MFPLVLFASLAASACTDGSGGLDLPGLSELPPAPHETPAPVVEPKARPAIAPELAPPRRAYEEHLLALRAAREANKEPANGRLKLETAEVKLGIAPTKYDAYKCGARFGATLDTKVEVAFMISGLTGKVKTARVMGKSKHTDLGRCIEAAAKAAEFQRFEQPQQKLHYRYRVIYRDEEELPPTPLDGRD